LKTIKSNLEKIQENVHNERDKLSDLLEKYDVNIDQIIKIEMDLEPVNLKLSDKEKSVEELKNYLLTESEINRIDIKKIYVKLW